MHPFHNSAIGGEKYARECETYEKGHYRPPMCECADPGCPVHLGKSNCELPPIMRLYRIDWEDTLGTRFCRECGVDALESGLFRDRK